MRATTQQAMIANQTKDYNRTSSTFSNSKRHKLNKGNSCCKIQLFSDWFLKTKVWLILPSNSHFPREKYWRPQKPFKSWWQVLGQLYSQREVIKGQPLRLHWFDLTPKLLALFSGVQTFSFSISQMTRLVNCKCTTTGYISTKSSRTIWTLKKIKKKKQRTCANRTCLRSIRTLNRYLGLGQAFCFMISFQKWLRPYLKCRKWKLNRSRSWACVEQNLQKLYLNTS